MFDIHKKWSFPINNKFHETDWESLVRQWKLAVEQWDAKFNNIPFESFLWTEKREKAYIIHIKITASERLKNLKAFW